MSASTIGSVTSWVVPLRTGGAAASRRTYGGAFGSAAGAAAAAGWDGVVGAADAAGAAVSTRTTPFIPASAWPGIEQRNVMPWPGTVTVPVTVAPASAVSFVPSAKVMSWVVEPVLWNETG